MSSADFMPRNLDRRVELLFPIEKEEIKQRLFQILEIVLRDTVKAKLKNVEKQYHNIDRRGKEVLSSQTRFEELAMEKSKQLAEKEHADIFIPITAQTE